MFLVPTNSRAIFVPLAGFLKRNMNCYACNARLGQCGNRERGERKNKITIVVSGNGQSPYAFGRQGCSNFKQGFISKAMNFAGDIAIDV